ncbi:MAG: hypothetical protein Q8P57_02355 [Candidatus Pacearchaeota archaeon]|nr:hypothetical protein [Candidatus Pacearchaeota archaeon]
MTTYFSSLKRWNTTIDEREIFRMFKNGVTNSLTNNLSNFWNVNIDRAFCQNLLIHTPPAEFLTDSFKTFKDFEVYNLFKNEIRPQKFFPYLQTLLNFLLVHSGINDHSKKSQSTNNQLYLAYQNILKDIKSLLSSLSLNVRIKEINGNISFYSIGAKLLDDKVVDESICWLKDYPEVLKNFNSALEKYQRKEYKRNLIDDLRLSLELLLRNILKNKKNLEKQNEELGKYLESKGINKEIRNMYWILLDKYSKYQNEYAKHNDKVKEEELEFMIYLTGTFIRFVLSLEQKILEESLG